MHELGHYNSADDELYVCFGADVIAIRPDSFAIVENGFKGYYFVPNRFASPVDVTALAKLASDLGTSTFGMQLSDSPLTEFLFARTPFDHLSPISPEHMATHIRTLAKTILEPEFGFVEGEAGWDSNRNRVRTMVCTYAGRRLMVMLVQLPERFFELVRKNNPRVQSYLASRIK